MDHLAVNYFELLKHAFLSYFGQTLIISLPSFIGLTVGMFLIVVAIILGLTLFKKVGTGYYVNKNRGATILFMLCSMLLSPLFLLFGYIALPENVLTFDQNHAKSVYALYQQKNINKFKNDSSLLIQKLQYSSEGNIFINPQQYVSFQNFLSLNNSQPIVRQNNAIEKTLNDNFLYCLTQQTKNNKKDKTIFLNDADLKSIKNVILSDNKSCLKQSVENILKKTI